MQVSAERLLRRLALVGFLSVVLTGCVKRTETIRVEPSGVMHLEVVFTGDPADIREGDAMLNDPGPWTVKDELRVKNDKGDEELTRTATLVIPAGGKVPGDYAGGDADLGELALNFTTTLQIERRPDGTYYHFKRVYHRRDWARIDYFRHKFLEEPLKKIEGKEGYELTDAERREVAQALVDFEAVKTLTLAQAAADAMKYTLSQDDVLAIHRAITDVFQQVDAERVATILQMDDDQSGQEIERQVQQVNASIEEGVAQVFAGRQAGAVLSEAFRAQLEAQRRRHAVAEDLQDESWQVVVQLPGQIVGHNSLNGTPDGGTVKWEFDGAALNDREEVLMATSVVQER